MALDIVSVRYRGNAVFVSCSTGEVFPLSLRAAADLRISASQKLDDEGERLLRAESEFFSCLGAGIRYLSLRIRSEKEMSTYLVRKKFDAEPIERALGYMRDHSLIDDEVFAKEYIAAALRKQKYGRRKIAAELAQKGISRSIAAELLPDECNADSEYERGMSAAVKKLKKIQDKDDVSRRLFAFLQQRGFEQPVIRRIIKTLLHENRPQ